MQRKTVVAIAIVLGATFGGGVWWMWQKSDKSTTPSVSSQSQKSSTVEEPLTQALNTRVDEIEEALNSNDPKKQNEIFAPFLRPIDTNVLPDGVTTTLNDPVIDGHTAIGTSTTSDGHTYEIGYVYTSETENGPLQWYITYAEEK